MGPLGKKFTKKWRPRTVQELFDNVVLLFQKVIQKSFKISKLLSKTHDFASRAVHVAKMSNILGRFAPPFHVALRRSRGNGAYVMPPYNENFNICLSSILTDSKSYSFIKSIKKVFKKKAPDRIR